jgi:hypothetical protein
VLDSYPHDLVLISPNAPARKLMNGRRDWILVYRDDAALIYARASSPAAHINGVPIAGHAASVHLPLSGEIRAGKALLLC